MSQVLFVDDELMGLNSLKRGLFEETYEKFFAISAEQALQIMEKEDISVLVTDMKMPVMTGLDLLKIVKEKYPDTIRIVLSGYTQLAQVIVTVNQGDIFKFITKPWDLEGEFKAAIREAVDYHSYKMEVKKAQIALEKKNATFQNLLKSYDEKILSIKDEVVLMRDINELHFKDMNAMLRNWDFRSRNISDFIEKFKLSQTALIDAFMQIPATNRRFSIKQLVDDVRAWSIPNSPLKHFEFGIDSRLNGMYKGKYDLILFLIRNAVLAFFEEDYETRISFVVSGIDTSETETLLKIVMECGNDHFNTGDHVELVHKILTHIAAGLQSDITVQELHGSKAVVISIVCGR